MCTIPMDQAYEQELRELADHMKGFAPEKAERLVVIADWLKRRREGRIAAQNAEPPLTFERAYARAVEQPLTFERAYARAVEQAAMMRASTADASPTLRRWAVEQAVASGACGPAITDLAERILAFSCRRG
jgi:hypothetical protein